MGKAKVIPYSQDELKELLDYNPESGELIWKERSVESFPDERSGNVWNARYGGKQAGGYHKRDHGYYVRIVRLHGTGYLAHRLIWKIMTNQDPPDIVDHINRDTDDNRWCNIREGTDINWKNKSLGKKNKSGYLGVSSCHKTGLWRARGQGDNGKEVFLGTFSDVHEAGVVAREWRLAHGYDENHGQERPYNIEEK